MNLFSCTGRAARGARRLLLTSLYKITKQAQGAGSVLLVCVTRSVWLSNLPKRFQRFGILRNFCAGVRTYLGQGLGLLRVKSLPGVYPKPPFVLILDSTVSCRAGGRRGATLHARADTRARRNRAGGACGADGAGAERGDTRRQ